MRLQNHRLMNRSRRIAVTGSQANESQPQNHRYRIAASNRSCRITVTGSLLQIAAAELQLQNRQNRIVQYRIAREPGPGSHAIIFYSSIVRLLRHPASRARPAVIRFNPCVTGSGLCRAGQGINSVVMTSETSGTLSIRPCSFIQSIFSFQFSSV